MKQVKLKHKINMNILTRPYNIGTYAGIIMGMGLTKMILDIINGYSPAISFFVFSLGVYVWLKIYQEDRLKWE